MFKLNNWKAKIYWDDLKSVLINGILFALVGGALAGLLDYLLAEVLGSWLVFGIFIISALVGRQVSKTYYNYHILYPVLSIVFMFIGLFSSMFMYLGMLTRSLDFVIYLLGMPETYLSFIIGPFYNLILTIKSFDLFELFMSIFNSIMYISAFITCYKMIKGRN